MLLPTIPQEWLDVLKEVQVVFPGAVIAGGALRDLFNGKPIKDVDIFIPTDDPNTFEDIWDMFAGENIELSKHTKYGVKTVPEDHDRDLYAIFNLKRTDWQYDLILCTFDACKVETFDINICQISHDGKRIHMTDDYLLGVLTNTLQIMNINRTDRNKARMERLHTKYPEFTIKEA